MAVTGARLAWCAETDRHAAAVLAARWPGRAQPRRHHRPGLGGRAARRPGHRRVAVPGHLLRRARRRHHGRNPQWPLAHIAAGLRQLRPATSSWRTSPRSAPAASAKVLADLAALGYDTQWLCLRAADAGASTAATASSSSPSGPGRPGGSRLLPTPVAGNFNDGESAGDLAGPPGPAEETRP